MTDINEDLYSSLQNASTATLEGEDIDSRFSAAINDVLNMTKQQKKTFRRLSTLPTLRTKEAVKLTQLSKEGRQREIKKIQAQIK